MYRNSEADHAFIITISISEQLSETVLYVWIY